MRTVSLLSLAVGGWFAFAGCSSDGSAADGVKNNDETDVDCGGSSGVKCPDTKGCAAGNDCTSAVCAAGTCALPTASDAVRNGAETDVDCGGPGNPKCAPGKACGGRDDCATDVCTNGTCNPPGDSDGQKNNGETDIDCGGPNAKRCGDALACAVDDDCTSSVCKDTGGGSRCQAPSPTDGKKNGTETDVDCGGTGGAKACAKGQGCAVGADCASLGCNDRKVCAAARSCTNPGGAGATTCGVGGAGGIGEAKWEDCCETADVTTAAGTVKMDKYQTTAGRMRVFLEAVGYNVRAFVKQARAENKVPLIPGNAAGKTVLDPAWDVYLPTSFAGDQTAGEIADCDQGSWDYTNSVCCENPKRTNGVCPAGSTFVDDNFDTCHFYDPVAKVCPVGRSGAYAGTYTAVSRHLGGVIFRANSQTQTGCFVGAPGTHAFRFPDDAQDGAAPDQPQSEYDAKSMQCIDYLVAQAFCVWDGGRLETFDEWVKAWGPGALPWSADPPPDGNRLPVRPGTNTYFGCRFPWATDATQDDCEKKWAPATSTVEYAAYTYSYEYPKQKNNDYIVFISAPGRTRGRGPAGHADLVGNNFELTSSVTWNEDVFRARHRWSGNGSWEGHEYNKAYTGATNLTNKYGKLGMRCVRP